MALLEFWILWKKWSVFKVNSTFALGDFSNGEKMCAKIHAYLKKTFFWRMRATSFRKWYYYVVDWQFSNHQNYLLNALTGAVDKNTIWKINSISMTLLFSSRAFSFSSFSAKKIFYWICRFNWILSKCTFWSINHIIILHFNYFNFI